jgi:hypothetical protein
LVQNGKASARVIRILHGALPRSVHKSDDGYNFLAARPIASCTIYSLPVSRRTPLYPKATDNRLRIACREGPDADSWFNLCDSESQDFCIAKTFDIGYPELVPKSLVAGQPSM